MQFTSFYITMDLEWPRHPNYYPTEGDSSDTWAHTVSHSYKRLFPICEYPTDIKLSPVRKRQNQIFLKNCILQLH